MSGMSLLGFLLGTGATEGPEGLDEEETSGEEME